jgi:hypothetical protein
MPTAVFAQVVDATQVPTPATMTQDVWIGRELNTIAYSIHNATGPGTTLPASPSTTPGSFILRRGTWMVRAVIMVYEGEETRVRLYSLTRATEIALGLSTFAERSVPTFLATNVTVEADEELFVIEQRNNRDGRRPSDDSRGVDRAWHATVTAELLVPDTVTYPGSPPVADAEFILLREVQPSGSDAGVNAPGTGSWLRRPVNDVAYDASGLASVVGAAGAGGTGAFWLPAGQYRFRSVGVAFKCLGAISKMIDITGARELSVGVGNYDAGGQRQTASGLMEGTFTLTVASQLVIETYCYTVTANTMLGSAHTIPGEDELYGLHEFWRSTSDAAGAGGGAGFERQVAQVAELWPSGHAAALTSFSAVDNYAVRPLNSVRANQGGILSLDTTTHIITLVPGKYTVSGLAACFRCNDAHIRLLDIDDNVPLAVGFPIYGPTYTHNQPLEARLTLERTTRFTVEQRTSLGTTNFMNSRDWGVDSVAVLITFTRFATDNSTGAVF